MFPSAPLFLVMPDRFLWSVSFCYFDLLFVYSVFFTHYFYLSVLFCPVVRGNLKRPLLPQWCGLSRLANVCLLSLTDLQVALVLLPLSPVFCACSDLALWCVALAHTLSHFLELFAHF